MQTLGSSLAVQDRTDLSHLKLEGDFDEKIKTKN
jgi:hypothetical protein